MRANPCVANTGIITELFSSDPLPYAGTEHLSQLTSLCGTLANVIYRANFRAVCAPSWHTEPLQLNSYLVAVLAVAQPSD